MENKEIIEVEDKFEIKDRGTVYGIRCPKYLVNLLGSDLLGQSFNFKDNDKIVNAKVIGVEQFLNDKLKKLKENDKLGLLIKLNQS